MKVGGVSNVASSKRRNKEMIKHHTAAVTESLHQPPTKWGIMRPLITATAGKRKGSGRRRGNITSSVVKHSSGGTYRSRSSRILSWHVEEWRFPGLENNTLNDSKGHVEISCILSIHFEGDEGKWGTWTSHPPVLQPGLYRLATATGSNCWFLFYLWPRIVIVSVLSGEVNDYGSYNV